MLLVLGTMALFLIIGLASDRVGRLQNALVAAAAIALAALQFTFFRFL